MRGAKGNEEERDPMGFAELVTAIRVNLGYANIM